MKLIKSLSSKLMLSMAIVLGIFSSNAIGAALECTYQKRPKDFFFEHLPGEILGWLRCSVDSRPLNIIYVAMLPKGSQQGLMNWFGRYENIVVPSKLGSRTNVKTPADDRGRSWREIETMVDNGESTTHFMFTINYTSMTRLAFVFSDATSYSVAHRASIKEISNQISRPEYIDSLKRNLH